MVSIRGRDSTHLDPVPSDAPVVAPDERLSWPRTIGIGAQHVVAMFGATFLVPVLTGFPPATTLLFSGIGTVLFLIITGNRLPSYLGSSFSVIAPVHGGGGVQRNRQRARRAGRGRPAADRDRRGRARRRHRLARRDAAAGGDRAPIVALIGFNLAPAAKTELREGPARRPRHPGAAGRDPGVLPRHHRPARDLPRRRASATCWRWPLGDVDTSAIAAAPWIGLPEFQAPSFTLAVLPLFLPAVIALVAENIGHVKSVGQMTDTDTDPLMGRAHRRRRRRHHAGRASAAARPPRPTPRTSASWRRPGCTRLRRTGSPPRSPSCWRMCPKVGAAISAIPPGVLGGATIVLVRAGRHPRRPHLADQPRRLQPADQPDDGRHPADHRHRRLHLDGRESLTSPASRSVRSPPW